MKRAIAVALLVVAPSLAAQDARTSDRPMLAPPSAIDARLIAPASGWRLGAAAGADTASQPPRRRRGRYGAGLIGFGVGAAAGIAVAVAAGPYDDCACEDPGLDQAVIGIAIGGLLGAGIGAALPGSDVEGCSRSERIAPGILGAVAGSALFVGLGALIHPTVAVFSVPFAAPYGAAFALKRCRWRTALAGRTDDLAAPLGGRRRDARPTRPRRAPSPAAA